MLFKRVNKVLGKVSAYGVKDIATGETVELDGYLAEKAKSNHNYELVLDECHKVSSPKAKVSKKKTSKKKK